MVDVSKLKEEELLSLSDDEEFNLEELILLGDEKKIPISIEFPTQKGERVKAKAYVKQLTLKELDTLKADESLINTNIKILRKALFKSDGENFNRKELEALPIGVVNEIANKILELSGVNIDPQILKDF